MNLFLIKSMGELVVPTEIVWLCQSITGWWCFNQGIPRMISNFSSRLRRINSDLPLKDSKERESVTVRLGAVTIDPFARRTVIRDEGDVLIEERKGVLERAPERTKLLLAPVSSKARSGVESPRTLTSKRMRFDEEETGEMMDASYDSYV